MSIYISASLLDDFILCNRKVYYRLNKPEDSVQNKEMVLGEIVHKAIELHYNSSTDAIAYIEKEVLSRLGGNSEDVKFAWNCWLTYYTNFYKFLSVDDKVEVKFKIPFDKDIFVVGKMDRISDGKVFDWKTTRNPPTNISGSVQFILYNWAYRKIYNREASGVYYASLTKGNLIRYVSNGLSEQVMLKELIPQAVFAIKNGDYTRSGVFTKSCFRCTYSEKCLEEYRHELDSSTPSKK